MLPDTPPSTYAIVICIRFEQGVMRERKRFSSFAGLLSVLAAMVGAAVAILDTSRQVTSEFGDSIGTIVAYAAVTLAITAVVISQLVRSSRDISEKLSEDGKPLVDKAGPAQPRPPLTKEEIAEREHRQHVIGVRTTFFRNRRRMSLETERIQRNGFLNLTIGILFSVISLGVLGYPLVAGNPTPASEWITLFERFAPRFSVGILIQLIGFFFLRLYVAGENEVHYIRNEITNVELREIAYHAAVLSGNRVTMVHLITEFSRTERNFKLKKGERALYSTDTTYNDMRQVLKDAFDFVRKEKSEN
jgi:hypothetical protein